MIKKFNIFLCALTGVGFLLIVGCTPTIKSVSVKQMPVVPAHIEQVPAGKRLPEKEKLTFHVKWLGITAGELVAEIKGLVQWQGRECYLIEVTARTLGFVSSIYRIDDHYRSYFDAEDFCSLRYEERRHEGNYRRDAVTDFDHVSGKAHYKNAVDGSDKTFDIPAGVHDIITASYAARLLDLEPGKSFEFKVSNSEKVYDLFASITQRVRVSRPKGPVDALHLVPFAKIDGHAAREGRVNGYLSADDKKVPLLVVIKAPVFTSVTAVLVE
ncbi:MAG: DUF3108 domain-containing protein [Candidatus Omnitrophota bacterium]